LQDFGKELCGASSQESSMQYQKRVEGFEMADWYQRAKTLPSYSGFSYIAEPHLREVALYLEDGF
jgi:hypothetical protein